MLRIINILSLLLFFCMTPLFANAEETKSEQPRANYWTLKLEGIFQGGNKPLYIYAMEKDGIWLSAVGSSSDPVNRGKRTFNKSWSHMDMSGIPIVDGKMKGQFKVHLTPDLWVPLNRKTATLVCEINATIKGNEIVGTAKSISVDNPTLSLEKPTKGQLEKSLRDEIKTRGVTYLGKGGPVSGSFKTHPIKPLPSKGTYSLNMQASIVGGDPALIDRCMVLNIGVVDGKVVSTIRGTMSQKFSMIGKLPYEIGNSTLVRSGQRFEGKTTVQAYTMNLEPCEYTYEFEGTIFNNLLTGAYLLTAKVAGKDQPIIVKGNFDGKLLGGIEYMKLDNKPWAIQVKQFKPVASGEHPRLLFRKSEVEALREKAKTPEGQAIIKRLRKQLNGGDGETMTTMFTQSKIAYDRENKAPRGGYQDGTYTISHAAGYGLLYQLTGDKKYAELGKQAFELAFKGIRDRDDRYSFRKHGGPLRAGPTIGWYALGYDLCYNGWDEATREKIGKMIFEYAETESSTLEMLARASKPPGSNHFGMQVGGALMALLVLDCAKFVDQDKIDMLLNIAQTNAKRNIVEGFGDGSFFAEGDGTGSMASHIIYLSSLQALKNVKGIDYINMPRPNARMTALKWIYLTRFVNGTPQFWPKRGEYSHNIWARRGISGGGYFAHGFGAITPEQQAGMKWVYDTFMRDADASKGTPYDTASPYPHISVASFVNWPVTTKAVNPEEVLPHAYRDEKFDFYAWRNRWQDSNDTIITVLLSHTTGGYMRAKGDKGIRILAGGKQYTWGKIKAGKGKHWSTSKNADTSLLITADGTQFAVDFTNASGVDCLLVTTSKAEGQKVTLGDKQITIFAPAEKTQPEIKVEGNKAIIGKQSISFVDGKLSFDVKD